MNTLRFGDSGQARGPTPRIQQQLEPLSRLPKAKQRAAMQAFDSVLAQADH